MLHECTMHVTCMLYMHVKNGWVACGHWECSHANMRKHARDMHAVVYVCILVTCMPHACNIYDTHIRTYNLCTYQLTLLYNVLIMYR